MFVCACVSRDIGDEEIDVTVEFRVTHYTRGSAGGFYEPPYGPEFEYAVTTIAGGSALTDAEVRWAEDWFWSIAGQERAYDVARDEYAAAGERF